MATLIPALSSCASRMSSGEYRAAERLEQELDDDYLLWCDVAVGPKHQHPNFELIHPRLGALMLEVKDFRLTAPLQVNKQPWAIHSELGFKTAVSLPEQARQCVHRWARTLERDRPVVEQAMWHKGPLDIPWSHGELLSNVTRQILQTANLVAADLLTAEDKGDDGVPLHKPVSCGCDDEAPLIVREEVAQVAELLATAHREGQAWGDMAILCRHWGEIDLCASVLTKRGLPHRVRKKTGQFDPAQDSIKVMSLHANKGLGFPVVALVGVGHMPAGGEDETEETRLYCVGATRATQRLFVSTWGERADRAKI